MKLLLLFYVIMFCSVYGVVCFPDQELDNTAYQDTDGAYLLGLDHLDIILITS